MAAFCAFSEEESISGAAFLLRVGSGTQHEQLPHGRRVRHRVSTPSISIRFEICFFFLFFFLKDSDQEWIPSALATIHMQMVLTVNQLNSSSELWIPLYVGHGSDVNGY